MECKLWKVIDLPNSEREINKGNFVVFGEVIGIYINDNFINKAIVKINTFGKGKNSALVYIKDKDYDDAGYTQIGSVHCGPERLEGFGDVYASPVGAGGYTSSSGNQNLIQFMNIQTQGNGADFGLSLIHI